MAAEVEAPDGAHERELEQRLGLVAHELLTPLVVAQGYATLLAELLEDRDGDEEVAQFALGAARNIDLAMLLLQRLRDTSASADELALDRAEIDLSAVVAQIVTDLSSTVAGDHPVAHTEPDRPVLVKADEVRIRQILFNLLVNAVKYSDRGAPIHVTLTVDEEEGIASVVVRNHGFGVVPEDAERLFQKGTRGTDDGPGGLGVGLFISRVIAEAHGGSLDVEPAEVRGSRFLLRLPIG